VSDIGFKRSDNTSLLGYPTRAKACSCGRQVVDKNDGVCITCGHTVRQLIDREWEDQAWRNRGFSRRSGPPFREGRGGQWFKSKAAA
jgi:ribosomal protein L37E